MNDNHSPAVEAALDGAREVLDAFIAQHRAAAIPAMLSAIVGRSGEHGASEAIFGSLVRTAHLVPAAAAAWKGRLS